MSPNYVTCAHKDAVKSRLQATRMMPRAADAGRYAIGQCRVT